MPPGDIRDRQSRMNQGEIDSNDDAEPRDPGVWTEIDPRNEAIQFREDPMLGSRIDRARPFNQGRSDDEDPIRIVEDSDKKLYVMQGNHRIYGAREDDVPALRVLLYSVEQWQSCFTIFRKWGTNSPRIIR